MPYLATILITLLLTVSAMPVELFKRGHGRFVREISNEPVSKNA